MQLKLSRAPQSFPLLGGGRLVIGLIVLNKISFFPVDIN